MIKYIRYYISLIFGYTQAANHSQRRYTRIIQSGMTAMANKGIALLVSIISIPLTVGYLGAERYGVWVIISSLTAWISIADLGLVNGLTNVLSEAYGNDRPDLAQKYVASAFWILSGVAIIIGCGYTLAFPWIDWSRIFNIQLHQTKTEITPALTLAIIIFLLRFPLSIATKVYIAYQEGVIDNCWAAASNISSLIGIILVTQTHGGLIWLVLGFSGSELLLILINTIWLFGFHKPWLRPSIKAVQWSGIRKLFGIGIMFFVTQISTLLIFQTDNIIISRYLSPSEVTPYSITWRLFSYINILPTLISPYLWTAYGEAFARKDVLWIQRTFRIYLYGNLFVSSLFALFLVFFGDTIIIKWAGAEAVPPFSLLVWMGIWSVIYGAMSSVVCVLGASSHLKGYMLYGTLTAILNVGLSIILVKPFGITGVIASTVISTIVCSSCPAFIETLLLFKRMSSHSKLLDTGKDNITQKSMLLSYVKKSICLI